MSLSTDFHTTAPSGVAPLPDGRDAARVDDILVRLGLAVDEEDGSERRIGKRFPYPVTQLLAPYDGKGMPPRHAFQSVRCLDISTGGVSFYMPEPPLFDYVVMGLGSQENMSFLVARYVYHQRVSDMPPDYLVGCRFIKRLLGR